MRYSRICGWHAEFSRLPDQEIMQTK